SIKAATVVLDGDLDNRSADVQTNHNLGRVGVIARERHQLLNASEDHDFAVGGETPLITEDVELDFDVVLFAERVHVATNGRDNTEVVEHHRAQVEDEVAHFLESDTGDRFEVIQF